MKQARKLLQERKRHVVTSAFALWLAVAALAKSKQFVDVRTVFFNSFEIKVNKKALEFTWVCTEYNNKEFVIQYSTDGLTWADLAIVPSKKSAESLETYTYQSVVPISGKYYYRVSHTNIDNSRTGFSAVRIMTFQPEPEPVSIWPNPATSVINIMNNTKGIIALSGAVLFDLSGKMMREVKLEAGLNTISVNELPSGAYLLKIERVCGTVTGLKFIKQ